MIITHKKRLLLPGWAANYGLLSFYPRYTFFIVAELMVSLGFVNFLGVIMEPIMRPLFRLPGCSSLVIVMGFTSGFPIGAS